MGHMALAVTADTVAPWTQGELLTEHDGPPARAAHQSFVPALNGSTASMCRYLESSSARVRTDSRNTGQETSWKYP